ncbi:glycosyltransferase [Rhodococcus opacus]|uniref:glycosyltransferase n=1 Tax=Rhodococcus opacus TaxID=37919 RepID=UPI0024BB0639|nr:glycosyltransferase [Rhodococcus opacus]MDJ0414387.1 glycosyltransferase [Rhodococcus opacus]
MISPGIDAAVFACYNPPSDVVDRIIAVSRAVRMVFVVDDASRTHADELYERLANCDNVTVVTKASNSGIAHSLNLGFVRAMDAGAEYILTLDQDTTVDEGVIALLNGSIDELDAMAPGKWGAVGPGTVNGMRYHRSVAADLCETYEIIQSAAVFSAGALRDVGLADESLVIDCVDTDLCLRLRAGGFGVYVDERIRIAHPIGSGNSIRILGRRVSSTDHSASRRYYIIRNRLLMFRRYGRTEIRWLLISLRRLIVSTILSLTIEQHRLDNLRATGRGVLDFVRGRLGPRPAVRSSDPGNHEPHDGVAVVLVTHNGMTFLREQVDSMLEQVMRPEVIFVVDDHSSDGSREFVVGYVAERGGPRVEIVEGADRTPSSDLFTRIAANFAAGIEAASNYRFIALSDQDDLWESDRLTRQRDRLLSTGALLTVGNGRLIDEEGTPTGLTLRDSFPVLGTWTSASGRLRLRSILRAPMATGAAMMLDRNLVPQGLPIPAGWLHDRWLSLAAAALGALDVDVRPVIRYRVYPAQVVGMRTRTNKPGGQHLSESAARPYRAARKLFDLSVRLRGRAVDPELRRELRLHRLLRTYLSGNVE